MYKKTIIIISLIVFSEVDSAPYETAQRLSEGDVVSAEVFNDILDRIELTLRDVKRSEMIGTWSVTAYECVAGANDPAKDAVTGIYGCLGNSNWDWDGAESIEGGIYAKRSDTWTITAVDGSDTRFKVATTNYNFLWNDTTVNSGPEVNQGLVHECVVIDGQAMLGCVLDPVLNVNTSIADYGERRGSAYFNFHRLSQSRIKLWWGPVRGGGLYNIVVMDKTDIPPQAPTSLSASLTGSGSSREVSLSWTINGSNATGAEVRRKSSVNGDWSTISTTSSSSYTDSNVSANNSYWYRVFATNDNGTSIGSNVRKVNWYNSPPSIDISSTISTNDSASNNTSGFANLSVSDADGDTLSLSLESQSPGSDADSFNITNDNRIAFNSSPNYNLPGDSDSNNIYDLKLTVSDGTDSVTIDFSVVVLDGS